MHNQILITPVEDTFTVHGAETRKEVAIRNTRAGGYVDLVADLHGRRIAVEVEMTPRRVALDLVKAQHLGADELWIVVPDAQVRRRVTARLSQLDSGARTTPVFVLTLSQARQRVRKCFPLFSASNVPGKQTNNASGTGRSLADDPESR